MTDLNEHQLEALEKMRHEFQNHNGHGMPLDDSTFLRYLRARLVYLCSCLKTFFHLKLC